MQDGRIQLVHKTNLAQTLEDAEIGIRFMADMLELSKQHNFQLKSKNLPDEYGPLSVLLLPNSDRHHPPKTHQAGPAQFGLNLKHHPGLFGKLLLAQPLDACLPLAIATPATDFTNKIVVAKRGNCIFIDKARNVQKAGGLGLIIVDNAEGTSYSGTLPFSMSGDGMQDVSIPSVFLFAKEGNELLWQMRGQPDLIAYIGDNLGDSVLTGAELLLNVDPGQIKRVLSPAKKSKRPRFWLEFKQTATACLLRDFKVLAPFYGSFPRLESSSDLEIEVDGGDKDEEEEEEEAVVVLDDVIHLVISKDGEKYLDIRWDALMNDFGVKNEGEEKISGVFAELMRRFEASTNVLSLNNREVYAKALRNWLGAQVEVGGGLAEHDRTFLKLLAAEIDYGPNSSDVEIMSRLKKKNKKETAAGSD